MHRPKPGASGYHLIRRFYSTCQLTVLAANIYGATIAVDDEARRVYRFSTELRWLFSMPTILCEGQ